MDTPPPLPDHPKSDETIWIVLCHISLLLSVGIVLPLIVYLVKREDAPLTAEHAREALNFHISVVIYSIISTILIFVLVGFVMLVALGIGSLVLSIIASIKASEGTLYRYPLTLRLV